MYAALSVTASETESFSESLLSSLKACLRFLSWDSWTWLLLSHVLIRSTLDFMAPARATDVIGVGRVLRRGRTLVNCEAEIVDPEGKLVAKALATYKVG